MNTKYIAQCAAAKELQKEWKPEYGDHIAYPAADKTFEVGLISIDTGHVREPELIWLPTQEQLWAMLPKENAYTLGRYKGEPYGEIYWGDKQMPRVTSLTSESLEGVLLEMFMLVKYEKDWDSKKGAWV